MYNKIIDPITCHQYSLSSESGKRLLKQYIKQFYDGGDNDDLMNIGPDIAKKNPLFDTFKLTRKQQESLSGKKYSPLVRNIKKKIFHFQKPYKKSELPKLKKNMNSSVLSGKDSEIKDFLQKELLRIEDEIKKDIIDCSEESGFNTQTFPKLENRRTKLENELNELKKKGQEDYKYRASDEYKYKKNQLEEKIKKTNFNFSAFLNKILPNIPRQTKFIECILQKYLKDLEIEFSDYQWPKFKQYLKDIYSLDLELDVNKKIKEKIQNIAQNLVKQNLVKQKQKTTMTMTRNPLQGGSEPPNSTDVNDLGQLFSAISIEDTTPVIDHPPDDNYHLFQVEITEKDRGLFKVFDDAMDVEKPEYLEQKKKTRLGVHCNDCVPTTFHLLKLISTYKGILIAQHNTSGIYIKDYLDLLNKRYRQFLFGEFSQNFNILFPQPTYLDTVKISVSGPQIQRTLLPQQLNLLKYVKDHLRENYACILSIDFMNNGVPRGHTMSMFKYKGNLVLLDAQNDLIITGLKKIADYFLKYNVYYFYVVVYKNNPDWNTERRLPDELLKQSKP